MKKNVHEIEIVIEGKEWENILDKVFKKKVKDVKIDGFRKGCVPKDVYIKKLGIETLFMDAVDDAVDPAYRKVIEDNKLVPIIEPKLDVKEIDKDKVKFVFTITEKPEIKLGDYTKLGIKKDAVKVTKKEIDEEIDNLRTRFAEIVVKKDGVVKAKDTAVINFKGYVDGKELDGGTGENYPLEIGSHTFIPGFEEAVEGMKVDEEKTIDLKFPDDYVKELAGKEVKFDVKVVEIKERVLPEIDKDLFEDLGYKDVKTKEEFEEKVKSNLEESKKAKNDEEYAEKCLDKAANNMKVDLNEEIIDDEVHHMMHNFEHQLSHQGLNLEQYYEFTKTTHDDLHKQMEPEAIKRIKYRYLLEEVIDKEKIEVSDKDAEKEAETMAKNYGMKKDEFIESYGGLDFIKYDMKMRKAIDIVKA
ncbi:MAG: trigger factor [Firmicutes bacterium]|nr:trigger factor [Bacillota bacterium]